MFKRVCDNCKKTIKDNADYISIDLQLRSSGSFFNRHDFCVGCAKSVGKFVEKAVSTKKKE